MKIIDLLNKIANDEDIPKKIIYKNIEYEHEDIGYYNKQRGYLFDGYDVEGILNDEVEILNEKEKIEKIDMFDYFTGYWCKELPKDFLQHLENNFGTLNSIINELIDEVNKLKESGK